MTAKVSPIPAGYSTITPYLGMVMNAEVRIGDSMLMCADPKPGDPSIPACFYLYVTDTDAWYARAVAAGAESVMKPADQFYGDRNAGVKDAFGNQWWFATHVEDVSDAEIAKRAQALSK